jgi:hypothetical protein
MLPAPRRRHGPAAARRLRHRTPARCRPRSRPTASPQARAPAAWSARSSHTIPDKDRRTGCSHDRIESLVGLVVARRRMGLFRPSLDISRSRPSNCSLSYVAPHASGHWPLHQPGAWYGDREVHVLDGMGRDGALVGVPEAAKRALVLADFAIPRCFPERPSIAVAAPNV